MIQIKNLEELKTKLKTQKQCLAYFEEIRWGDQKGCPHCGSVAFSILKKDFQYRCKDCRKHFNVLTGTIFENTKIALSKWFTAIYLATTNKKGINSHQLSRDIDVTQKTSWFMLHRIRVLFNQAPNQQLEGHVEVDECYIGGNQYWRHEKKKKRSKSGQVINDKTPVIGLLQRDGSVITKHIPTTHGLADIVRKFVKKGSTVSTDTLNHYNLLRNDYTHAKVAHRLGKYVNGNHHTNGIEGVWSHLKRGINGMYHQVSRKHLQAYLDEFTLKYNTRDLDTPTRINYVLKKMEGRLKYKDLIAA